MKLLLDTSTLLWFLANDPQLSATARESIEDTANATAVSAASLWEIAIKLSIGKLKLPAAFGEIFPRQLHLNGFGLIGADIEDFIHVAKLPLHHRDPFDRLLIAQALVGSFTIVGRDSKFANYGVPTLW